jgi:hypothetical protein
MGKRNAAALERPSHEVQSRVAIVGPGLRCHCGVRWTICHTNEALGPSRLPFGPNWQLDCFFLSSGLPKDQQQSMANYMIFFFGGELLCCQLFFYARCRYHEHLESIGAHLTAVFLLWQGVWCYWLIWIWLTDASVFFGVWSMFKLVKLREKSGKICTPLKCGFNNYWNFRRIFEWIYKIFKVIFF